MKALIEWIKNFLGLVKVEKVEEVTPVVREEPVTKAEVAAGPKVTKASLNKLTKAQLEDRAAELGVILKKGLKKAELVNELFKAEKK